MKIVKTLLAIWLVFFFVSSAHAYTWDQINLENTYGTGENTALLVIDFSNDPGDSFAWEVNFDGNPTGIDILGIAKNADPDLSVGFNQIIRGISYGDNYSAEVPWFAYDSDDLGETWNGTVTYQVDTVADGDTIGFIYGMGAGNPETPVVPVPAAVWLLGSGLIGLVGFCKRK